MKDKQLKDYPKNIRARIERLGGLEAYRADMRDRASRRRDFSKSYFGRLKREGKLDELKELSSKGVRARGHEKQEQAEE